MTDTWPPSAETLETWAFVVDAVNEPEYTTPELAAFLRDPRLREALELAEAVKSWRKTERHDGLCEGGPCWCRARAISDQFHGDLMGTRYAVKVARAVAWCVEHNADIRFRPGFPGHGDSIPASDPDVVVTLHMAHENGPCIETHGVGGGLPEAVRALRAKIEKEGA